MIYLTNPTPQLKAVIVDPHPQIDVYVNDSDISFFKIILEVRPFEIVFDFAYNVSTRHPQTKINVHIKMGHSFLPVTFPKVIPEILRKLDLSPSFCIQM
jgi:hypothetical protein